MTPSSAGLAMGHQGAAWDVVFAGPEALAAAPGFESARLDDDLGLQARGAVSWKDEWPSSPRPSLDRQRWVRLRLHSRDSFTYFRDE